MFVSFSVVCCQVGASVTGRSLVQRSPAECGVSEYDLQNPTMRKLCISISSSSSSGSSNSNSSLAFFHQQIHKIPEYPVFFLQYL